ncbi:mCG147361 [Mus musculus]|nr:mCG147361 [Mus musculus]
MTLINGCKISSDYLPFIFCLFIYLFLIFRDRVSLYIPGCSGTHFVDQAEAGRSLKFEARLVQGMASRAAKAT